MSTLGPLLEFRQISKGFFGVPVLQNISFQAEAGCILGLVGENGAGKSTLMNLLAGIHAPDRGDLLLQGQPYTPRQPLDASRAGVAFIQQELNLFPNLTIAENVFIGRMPTRRGVLLDRRSMHQRTSELLRHVGLPIDPATLVSHLSTGERQLVEVAKALSFDARVVIFDEPTTSLTHRETARLFSLMGELRERGALLIFISHNLEDVVRLSDRIVVLRDGELVAQGATNDFDVARLISLMVGRSLDRVFPPIEVPSKSMPLLEVSQVSQPGIAKSITFTLHQGEILGLSGLMGSGRSELARILFGLDPHASGEIRLEGGQLASRPRDNIARGLAFVTEDRREEGLCLAASIADNMALVSLSSHAAGGWLRLDRLRSALERIRQAVRLNPSAGLEQPVRTLSGGNQQKVVLAKWLLAKPRVIILDEPTRGVDVGAKVEIYQLIAELRHSGAGVLVISSELEELLGLCDRILVMNRGELRDELPRSEFDRERILRAALHERAEARP